MSLRAGPATELATRTGWWVSVVGAGLSGTRSGKGVCGSFTLECSDNLYTMKILTFVFLFHTILVIYFTIADFERTFFSLIFQVKRL